MQGHGYSIVNFLVEKDVQLVQLRNLWGSSWRGGTCGARSKKSDSFVSAIPRL